MATAIRGWGSRVGSRAIAAALCSLWVICGCGKAREVHQQRAAEDGCTSCHGTAASNAAPPVSVSGEQATTAIGVGAHQIHLRNGELRDAIACTECHVVPATRDAPGHLDGAHATVTFGTLSREGGAQPVWNRDTATCAGTYCHGGTLSGGAVAAPSWVRVDGTQAACGACHGVPPPPPHVQNAACEKCHAGYVAGTVARAIHVNGSLEVVPLACNTCHGSSENAAPPAGTAGETERSSIAVGAHQAHLHDGRFARAMDCTECHVVPTETMHATGRVELVWGRIATAGGASPAWDRARATCASAYCHGATLAGGANTSPVWTAAAQAECGACHGLPPPPPHPASAACNRCHPGTVRADGSIDLAGGKHVNGVVDVEGLGCNMCHGSDANAAPPVGTHGETDTTTLAVGAHQAHVRGGALHGPLECRECHVVPATPLHSDGVVDLAWGTLARTGGATPAFDAARATCASTYCHGATLSAGGSLVTPVWTKVDGTQAACGTCHGAPPPSPHPPSTQCSGCHAETVNADGTINLAGGKHIDGKLELTGGGCNGCHGSADNPAPPLGTHGETATTALAVGAHQQHVRDTAIRSAMSCGECHVVPQQALHSNGTVDMAWGPLATAGGASPVFTASTATCASTYCHGATLNAGGEITMPTWTKVDGSAGRCASCHGFPPPPPHPANGDCGRCHPTVVGNGVIDVAGGLHVNGRVDVSGLSCSACHGSAESAAPPVGTHGETATTSLAVGAHQAHLRDGPLRRAVACGECHPLPADVVHSNGTIDFSWGSLARTGGASPAFDASSGTCASTYCHGATLNAGGSLVTPVWTRVDGSQAACGTCHGAPPPAPHPPSTQCSGCHAETVNADGTINVAGGKHIDGTLQVSGGGCNACHGSADNPAPPLGTRGETATTALAVGAHQAHVRDTLIRKAMSCSECHVVPAQSLHSNGKVDMAWGPLATAGGASPVFDASNATCRSTYCHGGTLADGTNTQPIWTLVDGTQAACGTCHGIPPFSAWGHSYPFAHDMNACTFCHYDVADDRGTTITNPALHVNGIVDVRDRDTDPDCISCHLGW
jgi:predicted CxxxxCH...CXXCH cytochrome family protein